MFLVDTFTLNVLSPSASNRSINAAYWQESDCKKYGVSVYKTENGEVVDSGEFDKNSSISFALSAEGDYTIEVIAYNEEGIPIAGGSKDKTLSYGDNADVIIYVIPYQKGFDITLNDGIEVVWANPDTTGNPYTAKVLERMLIKTAHTQAMLMAAITGQP